MALAKKSPRKPPTDRLILKQVEKICAHETFQDRDRLPDFLRFLVEMYVKGRFNGPFSQSRPKPTGKSVSIEFYDTRVDIRPDDPIRAGKKQKEKLWKQLAAYYSTDRDPKIKGPVFIAVEGGRGKGYKPYIKCLDEVTAQDLANYFNIRPEIEPVDPKRRQESIPPIETDLANILNARLSFLNDPEFGREMRRYFDYAVSHGIYCHDLRTTFSVREVDAKRYPDSAKLEVLKDTCFDLTIKEAVDKICAPDRLRFAVFRHSGFLAHHFVKPEVDFVWHIDLADDAVFTGKLSDIFRVDKIEVDGTTIVSDPYVHFDDNVEVVHDDRERFVFEIDLSKIEPKGELRRLRYTFHTLKAKDYRYIAYGTRVLTRGMTLKVEFARETGIESVVVQPSFSGDEAPKPSEFDDTEISVSGWLLPRSGATFSFRYDKPYRQGP